MATGVLGWDDPSSPDKYLETWSRSIGGTTKEDQVVIEGEAFLATYSALASSIATTTSASHLIFIQGDGTNYVRLRRIFVQQVVGAGSATLAQLQVLRTTTAGSGGSAISAYPYDTADTSPYAGTIQTLPSSKGTEGALLLQRRMWLTNSIAADPVTWEWTAKPNMKPIILPSGTADGACLKIVTGIATATVDITLEFSTTAYL